DAGSGFASSTGFNGVFFVRSSIRLASITRGTSNVVCVAEKYLNPLAYVTGTDGGDNEAMYVGFDNDVYRCTANPPLQDKNGLSDTFRFGSAHPAGLNVLLCDGSVQFINYNIDATVWLNMGN